jgi:hypothetical protein
LRIPYDDFEYFGIREFPWHYWQPNFMCRLPERMLYPVHGWSND